MPELFTGSLTIGGTLPSALVGKLCTLIQQAQVTLEWDGPLFMPIREHDLLDAREDGPHGPLLTIKSSATAFGEFPDLELFCQYHRIPYTRISECKYEYDGERIEYRPGMSDPARFMADTEGAITVPVAELRPVLQALTENHPTTALAHLRPLMGIQIPPLSPFTIKSIP